MKGAIFSTLLIWTLFACNSLFGEDLHWESSLESAFEKASKTHMPIMVISVSKSCRWCKKMKQETLADEQIISRLQSFILVHVDRDEVHSKFVPYAQYVPTIFFMTPEKKIIAQVVGYFDVPDFKSWIDDVEKRLEKRQ